MHSQWLRSLLILPPESAASCSDTRTSPCCHLFSDFRQRAVLFLSVPVSFVFAEVFRRQVQLYTRSSSKDPNALKKVLTGETPCRPQGERIASSLHSSRTGGAPSCSPWSPRFETSRGENRKLLAFFAQRWCSMMCSLVLLFETHSRMCVDLFNLGGCFSTGDLPSKSGALFLGCCSQVRSCQDTSSKRSRRSLFRPVFELLQLCPHSFALLHSPQVCQTEACDLAGSRIFVQLMSVGRCCIV